MQKRRSRALPGKKALIVTTNGQSVIKYGYLDRVKKELDLAGVEYTVFAGIRPNPTDINVMDCAKAVKENGCDFVIALGGGSVMDCTKCIALMAANPGDIWDYSLSERRQKECPISRYPDCLCDLMMSVPPKFTAYQGMDAFFHT